MGLKRRVGQVARHTGLRKAPPPEPPRDGDPAPPDFVGVGAMKAGTTWWYSLIAAHPGVLRAPTKELHFFDTFTDVPFTDADRSAYWSSFTRTPGVVSGEWTPRYMYDFWTMPLLRSVAPDAKLLVLLRDPVERFSSGIHHSSSRDRESTPSVVHEHFARGLYHEQLTNVLCHFPREQLLVLQFERCIADARCEIARTYRHLGLDDGFVPDFEAAPRNTSRVPRSPVPAHVADAMRARYRDDLARLFADFAELDPALWPSAAVVGRGGVTAP